MTMRRTTSTKVAVAIASAAATVSVVALLVGLSEIAPGMLPQPLASLGDAIVDPLRDPDKLGWMDNSPLSDSDLARIASITGSGYSNHIDAIHSIQAGDTSSGGMGITRKDFELLRQDRRRAEAAYPDIPRDDLLTTTWVSVSIDARVPESFCTSYNSDGTEVDGKWYLDGSCDVTIVNPRYTKRADAATTKRVLHELKERGVNKRVKHFERWGYYTSISGSDGHSTEIRCYPSPLPSDTGPDEGIPGKCQVIIDGSKQYVFPFNARELADTLPDSLDEVRKLDSFKYVEESPYKRPSSREPWARGDGQLVRGQKCAPNRLCRSHWNEVKDNYDNVDIGPSDPTCWSISNGFFASVSGYMPCSQQRSIKTRTDILWNLTVSYYGNYADQASPGWTEKECKDLMPKYLTGFTTGLDGQDPASLNDRNLREVRCIQDNSSTPLFGNDRPGGLLANRQLPTPPPPQSTQREGSNSYPPCVQGGTLMPGQSCSVQTGLGSGGGVGAGQSPAGTTTTMTTGSIYWTPGSTSTY